MSDIFYSDDVSLAFIISIDYAACCYYRNKSTNYSNEAYQRTIGCLVDADGFFRNQGRDWKAGTNESWPIS